MRESSERGQRPGLRSSALWGKGGRGFVLTVAAALALAVPVAASAGPGLGKADPSPAPKGKGAFHDSQKSWDAWAASHGLGKKHAKFVQPSLLDQAGTNPNELVQVIVQSDAGVNMALKHVGVLGGLHKLKRLDLVNGITVQVPAKWVPRLAAVPGLTVTVDAPMAVTSWWWSRPKFTSGQLWPYVTGNAALWPTTAPQPTIAVVDSGIDPATAGLGSRLLADVNLSTVADNSAGDGLGHGTMVSAIAAGSQSRLAGADPTANLVSLDVIGDSGDANASDVIAACDWILQHQQQYDIRVANFSLASTQQSNFMNDPLDQAVERLWFHGVTVVAAAGNYGNADGTPSGVVSAPGNDPFVITVGAADVRGTGNPNDDVVAPWSAWGRTHDGFMKPELVAPGRYITGPVPPNAALHQLHKDRNVGWSSVLMNLSGTSFAAPVVAGTAAELLAVHPAWTPDDVKGALMASARRMPAVTQRGQAGVGELDAVRAVFTHTIPNPNAPLEQFVSLDQATGDPTFATDVWTAAVTANPNWDQVSWDQVSWDQVSWDQVSWDQVSWDQVSWDQVSWDQVSWDQVSWDQVSWDQVSWDQVSWDQVSWDQAASADAGPLGYDLPSEFLPPDDTTQTTADGTASTAPTA